MALQQIVQILSPTNAPYINGINGEKRISAAILKNLYQGLVEKNGKGVDDNFVTEDDAEHATQVVVHRVLPTKMKPRELGSSKNGGSYSQNQHYIQTIDVGIDILQVLDDVILIPRESRDKINVDLLAEKIQEWSDRWAIIYNGATTAAKILSTYLYKSEGNEINERIINSTVISEKRVLDEFIEGNSLLDEGDPAHGIDIFPQKTRIAVFRVSYRATLKASGVLVIGRGDEVYKILAGSGLNNQGDARTAEDGYIGEIDGVEVRLLSNESLSQAAGFLGFPENEFKKDGVFCGYIASSYANARGASTRETTKVVDEPNGQGIRLQPYVKFGAVCWYPLGNVFFTSEEWNPYGGLKGILSTAAATTTFKLKGDGSRLHSDLTDAKITNVSVAGGTASIGALFAADDWGVINHLKACAFVITTAAQTPKGISTLSQFLKYYSANSGDTVAFDGTGTVTISGAAAGSFLSVLTISDDGTVDIATKVLVA